MGPGFESQQVHKACHESDKLFCFEDMSKACFRKRTRSKNRQRNGKRFDEKPNKQANFGEGIHLGVNNFKLISLNKDIFLLNHTIKHHHIRAWVLLKK